MFDDHWKRGRVVEGTGLENPGLSHGETAESLDFCASPNAQDALFTHCSATSDGRKVGTQLSLPLAPGKRPRRLLWVDGVNSAVMAHFVLLDDPDAIPVHCDLGSSVHEDSHRFINDLEQWYGKAIVRIRSSEYANVDEVFEKRKYLSGPKGAPCTGAMKFVPRLDFQVPSDVHHWGYTADKRDAKRLIGMQEDYPELIQCAPLVAMGLKKKDTHAILKQHGIRRPYVYEIGMPNGNCLCCVKSSSPRYWAHQRKHFPAVFARRCDQARRFGARLVIIGQTKDPVTGKRTNIRCFPDEVPFDTPTEIKGSFGGCGFSASCTTQTEDETATAADALVAFARSMAA